MDGEEPLPLPLRSALMSLGVVSLLAFPLLGLYVFIGLGLGWAHATPSRLIHYVTSFAWLASPILLLLLGWASLSCSTKRRFMFVAAVLCALFVDVVLIFAEFLYWRIIPLPPLDGPLEPLLAPGLIRAVKSASCPSFSFTCRLALIEIWDVLLFALFCLAFAAAFTAYQWRGKDSEAND